MEEINIQQSAEALKEHGIRPSPPRIAVYRFLHNNRIHPAAETIYQAIHAEQPSLSRTTVYNTLKLLLDKRAIQEIAVEKGEMRYDIITQPHAHFKCRECGGISDIFLRNELTEILPEHDFRIEHAGVSLFGLCPECNAKTGLT